MSKPLVSIVCLSYNHAPFIQKCIDSVLAQSYQNIEIFLADDCSTDESPRIIEKIASKNPRINLYQNDKNEGNCRLFNKILKMTSGKYVIDLAADDVLHLNRVARQVVRLEDCGPETGVLYGNMSYIDSKDKIIGTQYDKEAKLPTGDIYTDLISRFIVGAPSMMIKREVLDLLNGYDESLAYEDFDFWIRSSRIYQYDYQPEVLTYKRVLPGSLSKINYTRRNQLLESTFLICRKIRLLNRSEEEDEALLQRLRYEMQHAWRCGGYELVDGYAGILSEMNGHDMLSQFIKVASNLNIRLPYSPINV